MVNWPPTAFFLFSGIEYNVTSKAVGGSLTSERKIQILMMFINIFPCWELVDGFNRPIAIEISLFRIP